METVWEFSEYGFAGRRLNLHRFPRENGPERVLTLSEYERVRKRRLLSPYRSQRANRLRPAHRLPSPVASRS
jgi:hypothetical protein